MPSCATTIAGLCFALEQPAGARAARRRSAPRSPRGWPTLYEDKLEERRQDAGGVAGVDGRAAAQSRAAAPARARSSSAPSSGASCWRCSTRWSSAKSQRRSAERSRAGGRSARAWPARRRAGRAGSGCRRWCSPTTRKAEAAARELASEARRWDGRWRTVYVLRAQAGRAEPPLSRLDAGRDRASRSSCASPRRRSKRTCARSRSTCSDRALLDRIDRLAIADRAPGSGCARVYGRARRRRPRAKAERLELLCRSAELLEQHAKDTAAALERLARSVQGSTPQRDDLLERAEAARACRRQPRRAALDLRAAATTNAQTDEQRARHLLRAARVADLGLQGPRAGAAQHARALTLTEQLPELSARDRGRWRASWTARARAGCATTRAGAWCRRTWSWRSSAGESFGPVLVRRAAQLLRDELGDDERAASTRSSRARRCFPNDLELYDALERTALKIRRLDALDAHLARCGDSARATPR